MTVSGQHPAARPASPAPAASPAQPGWAIWATVLFVSQRPRWQRLGLAILIVVAAVGLRIAFLGGLGRGTAYITFYPAVMLAALCGGWAAGLLASTLCTLLAYAWIQQRQLNPTEWLALAVFVASSALVSGLSELLHRAVRRLRAEVDEHTRVDAARRESEARYHAVLENLDDAVLLALPDGTILSANPAACRLFDHTEADLRKGGRAALVDPTDPRLPLLLATRDQQGRCRGPLRFRRRDASTFEGEIASTIFLDAANHPLVSIAIRNLTAQHLAAAQLERAAQEWQTTFDATRDAVWVLDRDSRILRANRTAEQRFGCPAAAMIGRPCWEIAHGTTAPIPECPLARAASSLQRATAELARGDRWWEIIVDPILDEAGRFAGAVHSVSDITERKRAELHLEERNALLDALINSPEDIVIFSLDRNYGYTAFNEKHRQEMRKVWAAEIRLGASLPECMSDPQLRALATRSIDRALGGEAFTEIQHQPSSDIHYEFVWNPIRQKDGSVSGVTAFIRDITERKRAELALAESEARFSATFEQASVGIAQVGLDGRWLRVNQRLCEIVGYAREELFQKTFQDVTHPDDLAADLGLVRKVLAGELQTYAMEKRYIRNDRSIVPVNLTVSLVREVSGEPKYFISVVEDITQRKLAESALLAAHANLERLVAERTAALSETNRLLAQTSHLAQVGGWEVDLRSGSNIWSGATREIHEVAEDFVPSVETALGFYAPEAQPLITTAVQRTSTTGEPFDLELPFITAKGTRLWVRATGQAVREQDRVVKIRGVFQDITERRRAEDELRTHRDQLETLLAERTAANERLRELDRLKSEFLSTMSHELRTPLNSIVGFTGILLKELSGPLNPEQNKQLGLVQSSARHLLALINDLLDLSRIESGRIDLHHEPFDFAGVVAEVTNFLTPIAQQKALALHADCAPAALPLVGDRRRSLQILLNLATNAVKFTEHGEVTITARLADGRLVVAVRDTGIGIRPDQLPLLFEAFRQLDASARRHYEGTGLGLHLCKKLLGLLGGTIAVESTAGVGSTFTFTLPLAPAAPGGTGLQTREPASAHGSGDPCHPPPGGAGFTPAKPSSGAPKP